MKFIASGAEANIYVDDGSIIKYRHKKSYRISQIDNSLRRFRTRRETKILEMLFAKKFPVPQVLSWSDKTMKIKMDRLSGKKIRDALTAKNCVSIGKEIGEKIGILHSLGIIHGDLTTSNMILQDEVYFIDFGLSFFSKKAEDRAVELHLLKETANGTHPLFAKKFYDSVISGYKQTFSDANEVLDRINIVEERGRNKKKMGS